MKPFVKDETFANRIQVKMLASTGKNRAVEEKEGKGGRQNYSDLVPTSIGLSLKDRGIKLKD